MVGTIPTLFAAVASLTTPLAPWPAVRPLIATRACVPRLVATQPGSSTGGGTGEFTAKAAAVRRAPMPSSRQRAQAKHRLITLFTQAKDAEERGATSLARSLLKRCLSFDSCDAHSLLALARLEAASGNEERAQSLFLSARAAQPGNVRLVHAHALFESRCGRPAAARAAFRVCLALEPGSSYAAHSWGQLEESLGKLGAARAVYARCPASPTVLAAWAALEARQANATRARSLFRAACTAGGVAGSIGGRRGTRRAAAQGRGWDLSPAEAAGLFIDWAALETRSGSVIIHYIYLLYRYIDI